MNKALKFISFLYLLVCFILESLAARLSKGNSSESPKEALRKCANRISDYSNRALRILGIRTFLLDVPSEIRSGLIVANHISYLDVLVLSRVAPLLFVTSTEVRDTPGLGLITRLAGCLFVERRNRSKIKSDSSDIQAALDSNIPVVLFPEGTSSDGSGVLPSGRRSSKVRSTRRRRCICSRSIMRTRQPPITEIINFSPICGESAHGAESGQICAISAGSKRRTRTGSLSPSTRKSG